MTVLSNPRYEVFARLRAEGKSGAQAAIGAGYSKRSARTQAARMTANDNVKARIVELQVHLTEKALETSALTEALVIDGLRKLAMICGDPRSKQWNPSAAIRAYDLLGRKLGLWVTRIDGPDRRPQDFKSLEELKAASAETRRKIEELEKRRAELIKKNQVIN